MFIPKFRLQYSSYCQRRNGWSYQNVYMLAHCFWKSMIFRNFKLADKRAHVTRVQADSTLL